MKGNTTIYITFVLAAVLIAGLLIATWNSLFDTRTQEGEKTAKAWGSYLFLGGFFFACVGVMVYYIDGKYGMLPAILHGIGLGLILGPMMKGSTFSLGQSMFSTSLFFNSITVIVIAVVIAMLFGVNYIGIQRNKKFDFNKNQLESLSDQTVKALKGLKEKVEVVGFAYDEQKHIESAVRSFLKKYRNVNRAMFGFRILNPDRAPQASQCYGVKELSKKNNRMIPLVIARGSCVNQGKSMVFKGKKIVVESLSEQDVTNKLIKVTRQSQKEICFLTGRAQPSLTGKGARYGHSNLKQLLEEKGFKSRAIDLVSENDVPSSCSVVVNAAPEASMLLQTQTGPEAARLSDVEVSMIERYLKKGGKLLAFQEPTVQTNLEGLFAKYGITTSKNLVIDFAINYRQNPLMPMAVQYDKAHEITQGFDGRVRTLFSWATPIGIATARPAGVALTSIVKTTKVGFRGMAGQGPCCSFSLPDANDAGFLRILQLSRAWRRNTMLFNIARGIVQKSVKGSKAGPFSLGVTAAKKEKGQKEETRIVVFGDTALGSNVLIRFNKALILNSLFWLAKEKDLVHIPPKRRKPSRIFLTGPQRNFINYTSQYGIPAFFLFVIFLVMLVRRHQ